MNKQYIMDVVERENIGGVKMIAVKGVYENGRLELWEDAPVEKVNVIVIFPEEQSAEKYVIGKSAKELFEEFTGLYHGQQVKRQSI